jgi:hypothetical protein
VSDGSFKDIRSFSGFLLEGPAGTAGRIYGTNSVPGNTSTKIPIGENLLAGIMGVLQLVKCILQVHNVHSGKLRLDLDGIGAMEQSRWLNPVRPSDRSFDLLAEIRALCLSLLIQVKCFWIERHQTEHHGWEDYDGDLNRFYDNLAKAYWNEALALPEPDNIPVNFTTWGFGYEGTWPGQLDPEGVYNLSYRRAISIPYWQDG